MSVCLLTWKLVYLMKANKIMPSYYDPSLKYINILCFLIHIISSGMWWLKNAISYLIYEIWNNRKLVLTLRITDRKIILSKCRLKRDLSYVVNSFSQTLIPYGDTTL